MLLNVSNLDKRDFLLLIENKRKEMVEKANAYGYVCEETIMCSQELDRLIITYQSKFKMKDFLKVSQ